MAAAGNGFVDCVSLLLTEGANVLATDAYQRSALHRAVSNRVYCLVVITHSKRLFERLAVSVAVFILRSNGQRSSYLLGHLTPFAPDLVLHRQSVCLLVGCS